MQGGYNNGARRSGHQGGMMVRGGAYGGGWGAPPPMYDNVPPSMYVAGYVRGPPTYPPQQYGHGGGYGGGGRGGHGGRYMGGGYGGYGGGGGYDEEDYEDGYRGGGRYDEEDYEDGYRRGGGGGGGGGGQGPMVRPTQNPNFNGIEIGSSNRTDNGDNQVRLRFDLSKLKDIPERAGGVKIGSGQYARQNGNMVDFSEYQDPAPAPPPQPQRISAAVMVGRIGPGYMRR